jgi:hypothetical protein
MNDELTELRGLHEQLQSGRYEGDRYELLHRFGNAAFVEARPTVESFLVNPDPELRYIALNVLVLHWGLTEHVDTCVTLAARDPDADVRRLATSCVGTLSRNTRSPDVLRLLLGLFADEGQRWDLRDASYSAILQVLGVPPAELPGAAKLHWPTDINWSRIREAQAIVSQSYAS